MKSWVKLYTEINHDPKFLTLTWEQRGIYSALLTLAGHLDLRDENGAETGELGAVRDVAWLIRCDLPLLRVTLVALSLSERKLVEDREGILFIPHFKRYLPFTNYRSENATQKWRTAVFDRDNYTCQECGARGVKLNAHHKRPWFLYVEGRFDADNGITLCKKCHRDAHGKGWKRKAR